MLDRRGASHQRHLSGPTDVEVLGLAAGVLARSRPPLVAYWLRGTLILALFSLAVPVVLRMGPFGGASGAEQVATIGAGANAGTSAPTAAAAKAPAATKTSSSGHSGHHAAVTSTTSASTTTTATTLAPTTDLLATPQLTSYLATRAGSISIALYNAVTGKTYLYRPGVAQTTASIIKVDILATVLHKAQGEDEPLSDETSDLATTMIENSNDNSAQELWTKVDGSVGVGDYDALIGATDTDLNRFGYWGLSTTTAADQVAVLKSVVFPNGVLDPASRDYELHLMENVESDQRWGVSGGVPSGVTLAIKDGWDPLDNNSTWQVNSIGWIDGQGRNYVLAVLTTGESTESYGIATIQGISSVVWTELAPAAA